MKKVFYLLLVAWGATMFMACSDDDDKDNLPVKGVEIPKFENPITPGQTVTIKGEGFDENSEIWFRAVATRTTDKEDVKAEVTGVDVNGITFIAPSVYGTQTILLKQEGQEYKLGEMLFADQVEEPVEVKILPKRIKKVTEWEDGQLEYESEYEYDAEGKITLCKKLVGSWSKETVYTYSDNKITVSNEGNELIFTVGNGRIESFSWTEKDCIEKYVLEYKEDYLDKVVTDMDGESETETFSFAEDNMTKYSYILDNDKDNCGSIEFVYEEQLNNLNIDFFYLIGQNCFDSNISEAFQFEMIGKRSYYMPAKMNITAPKWDEDDENIIGYETFTITLKYEMEGEYITKISIINREGETEWMYEIEYED